MSPKEAELGCGRVGFAIISNLNAPYRSHLHSRIARELPEVELHSIFTRGHGDFTWSGSIPQEVNPVYFGRASDSASRFSWGYPVHDLDKAVRIARYLKRHRVRAALFNFQCDPTMLSVFSFCLHSGIRTFIRSDANIRCRRQRRAPVQWIRDAIERRVLRTCDVVMPAGSLGQEY